MSTIRASCPNCGDIELARADVTVRVCTDDDHGAYVFRCPICKYISSKTAESRTIDLLVASGVKLETWSLPNELQEHRNGDAINHDDALDFHGLLNDEAAFRAALEGL